MIWTKWRSGCGCSVLATDLLPDPVKVDHQYFDISAFARSTQEEGEADHVVWKHVNTDGMDYSYERQRPQPAHNLPKLNGKVAVLDDYTKLILEGFEEAYRFLQRQGGCAARREWAVAPDVCARCPVHLPTDRPVFADPATGRCIRLMSVTASISPCSSKSWHATLLEAPDRPMTWPLTAGRNGLALETGHSKVYGARRRECLETGTRESDCRVLCRFRLECRSGKDQRPEPG